MRLHLVRHGDARPGGDDFFRTLSPLGRAESARLAERAAAAGVDVAEIRHSGLIRAGETADILAARLAPERGIIAMAGLGPSGDADTIAVELSLTDAPMLVVTHMPFIAELAARLLGPRVTPEPFRTAELRCLVRSGERWTEAFRFDGRDGA